MKFLVMEPEVELLVGTSKNTKKDDKLVSDFIKQKKSMVQKVITKKKNKNIV